MDSAWQDLVIQNLQELKQGLTKMHEDVTSLKVDQATMKAESRKDATWIAGIISAIGLALSVGIKFVWKH